MDPYAQTILFSRYYHQGSVRGYSKAITAMKAGKVDEAVTELNSVASAHSLDIVKKRVPEEATWYSGNQKAIEAFYKAKAEAAAAANQDAKK